MLLSDKKYGGNCFGFPTADRNLCETQYAAQLRRAALEHLNRFSPANARKHEEEMKI